MSASSPSMERMWELSDREAKIAAAPSAQAYRQLADDYTACGCAEEAQRVSILADALDAPGTSAQVAPGSILSGAFDADRLVRLLSLLQRHEATGVLCLQAPGQSAELWLREGRLVHCEGSEGKPAEASLRAAFSLPGGAYAFEVGRTSETESLGPDVLSRLLASRQSDVLPTPKRS